MFEIKYITERLPKLYPSAMFLFQTLQIKHGYFREQWCESVSHGTSNSFRISGVHSKVCLSTFFFCRKNIAFVRFIIFKFLQNKLHICICLSLYIAVKCRWRCLPLVRYVNEHIITKYLGVRQEMNQRQLLTYQVGKGKLY